MSGPPVTLVVSTHDNPAALRQVLSALAGQTRAAGEVIVAEDGMDEATAAVIADMRGNLGTVLHHCRQEHDGFRKAVILNRAIAQAACDYVVFLDGDSVPERHFVEDHVRLAERGWWVQGRRAFVAEERTADFQPRPGRVLGLAIAGKLGGWTKGIRLPFAVVRRGTGQRGILGCNLGIWRNDLIAINGYDEAFTGWGREDADLANRLYHLGRQRKFVYGRAVIYHLNHPVLPRDRLDANQALLEETMAERRIRARRGLDQHLPG